MTQMLILICLAACAVAFAVDIPDWAHDTSKECVECEGFMEGMYKFFENDEKIESIIAKVQSECEKIGNDKLAGLCDSLVEVLLTIPSSIFHGMDDLAWPVPQATCALMRKCEMSCCREKAGPEQIHLSLGGQPDMMSVSWVTLEAGEDVYVEYGEKRWSLDMKVEGNVDTYKIGGWKGAIYRATMTGLKSDTEYYYRVGSSNGHSHTKSFKTLKHNGPIRYGVIADMGYGEKSDDTVKQLTSLVEKGQIDVIVHSGDLGYADGYQPHWDVFFNKIEPIASKVPYMVTPGNHEFWGNFSAYKHRFFMPPAKDGSGVINTESMYYSWNSGYAHFVALNSETCIDTGNFDEDMLNWAERDMKGVNRTETPWVISHFHRPMYCTSDHDCDFTSAGHLRLEAEKMFNEVNVDLLLSGHVHSYERTTPVKAGKVMPQGKAPVYILQGASGNREGNKGSYPDPDDPNSDIPEWSAARKVNYGFGLMTVSAHDIKWEFYDSTSMELLDETTIKKQ